MIVMNCRKRHDRNDFSCSTSSYKKHTRELPEVGDDDPDGVNKFLEKRKKPLPARKSAEKYLGAHESKRDGVDLHFL